MSCSSSLMERPLVTNDLTIDFSWIWKGLMEQCTSTTQWIGVQRDRALSQFFHTEDMKCHMKQNIAVPCLWLPPIFGISHDQKLFSQQLRMDLYMYGTGWIKSLTDDVHVHKIINSQKLCKDTSKSDLHSNLLSEYNVHELYWTIEK